MTHWHPNDTQGLSGTWAEAVDMGQYASYRAGGKACYTYVPGSIDDLCLCLKQIPLEVPILFLGRSTNVLVSDEGFEGVVMLLGEMARREKNTDPKVEYQKDDGLLTLEAFISCPRAAQLALAGGLRGLEFMAGIPGTIGGALTMNAGSSGQSTWDHIERVEMVDRQGHRFDLGSDDFTIGYREVTLKDPVDAWFVRGYFRLPKGDISVSRAKIDELLAWRKAHQPLQLPSAGSVFRNPLNNSAGRLIESCGLKGFQIGQAMVSDRHANFIVNLGGATATDIIAVMEHVQQTVEAQTGIQLKREVKVIRPKTE